jgi:hypothetical protein
VVITFSEAMSTSPGTVELNSIVLSGGTWSVGGTVYTVSYSGLDYGTLYTVHISGFEEVSGNVMIEDSSHSFTTADVPDTTVPTVVSVTPVGTGAALAGNVVITFSEAMSTSPGTVELNSIVLSGGTWSVGGTVYTVSYSGLAYSASYTVHISGFKDVSGNVMTTDGSHSFTTVAPITPPSVTPPSVTLVTAIPSVSIERIIGNRDYLTITVTEFFSDGSVNIITKTVSINNNAAAYYKVGSYTVYVDTKGNDQIRRCYIVR